MELINNLVEKLGVTNEQAKGGTSLIFNLVKQNLDADDFSKIASKIPGVSSLVSDKKEEVEEKEESLMDKVGDMFGGDKKEEKEESLMDKVGDMFGGSDKKEEKEESLMDKVGDMFGGDKEEKEKSFMDKATDMIGSSSGVLDSLGLEKLGTMAKLTSGFNKLGLEPSTVTKFLPVVMNFVKSKGGSTISNLVLKALK